MGNKKLKIKSEKVRPVIEALPLKTDFLYGKRVHVFLFIALTFLFYFNSIFGEYVLDDMIVITHNSFTQMGFKGIKKIFLTDSFLGFTGMENQLAGGRYRPLSIVTYAIEYGLFGLKPMISHFINVVLYGGLIIILYNFLKKYIFQQNVLAAFLASILFLIHPIHTEVVANIKSRDEIMCFMFLLLSVHLFFDHLLEKKNYGKLLLSLFLYFLSLLSKENGLVYIGVIPLILFFFHKKPLVKSILNTIPFFVVIGLYFLLRFKITGLKMVQNQEILNAPFLYATGAQAFATKVLMLGKYLVMILIPYPMSYDYSFNQIKYVGLSDISFLFSFLVNLVLLGYALFNFKKRDILSFCILFYFLNMVLVSNFLFDVGTPFADRFLFQPSLALAIATGYLVAKWYERDRARSKRIMILIISGILILITGAEVIARNINWLSENNLFISDVKTCPNSAKTNNNCGVVLINLSADEKNENKKNLLLNEAVTKLQRSVAIHPKYVDGILNLGIAYSRLDDIESTEQEWLRAQSISPAHPKVKETIGLLGDLYYAKGFKLNAQKNYIEAIKAYSKAIQYNTKSLVDAYYNIGGNYLMSGNVEKAKEFWNKTLEIKPDHAEAKKWLGIISKH